MTPRTETPRLLAIETSGRVGRVALSRGEAVAAQTSLDSGRQHARDLVPAVAGLFAEVGWAARDLDGVIVSRGPGSYTGLRVGLMSAKALGFATGAAVLAIDTFRVIAGQVAEDALRVDVLADAQQNRVYVQRFVRENVGTALSPVHDLLVTKYEEWARSFEPPGWVTGPGLRVAGRVLPDGAVTAPGEWWDPHLESLLRLGMIRWRAGEADDCMTIEPLYLRPSSAEEQWDAPGGPGANRGRAPS